VGIFAGIRALFVPPYHDALSLLDLAFTLIPIIILVASWQRLPLHYSIFALLMVIFPLCYIQDTTLTAMPRYMSVIFPLFVGLATWKQPRVEFAYGVLALPLFAFNVILFVNHYWVA
jgi:hypothetical protein